MNEEKIKSDDYINLPGFKKISILILHSFFSVFHHLADAAKNSKLLLAVGLVTGLILGYSYYSTRPIYFEVSMIVESTHLPKQTVAQIVNQVDELIKTQSYAKLAHELNISEADARHLSHIGAVSLSNDALDNDTSSRVHQPFRIAATISNNDIADTIQAGIVNYLNNKPAIKKMNEEKEKIYRQRLIFIDRELAKLDTFKTEYNHFVASSKISATFYNNAFDPATIYEQSSTLMDDREDVLTWLGSDTKPIIVLDEFKSTAIPQSASLTKSLLIAVGISVLVCYLLGLFIDLNKKIKKYNPSE